MAFAKTHPYAASVRMAHQMLVQQRVTVPDSFNHTPVLHQEHITAFVKVRKRQQVEYSTFEGNEGRFDDELSGDLQPAEPGDESLQAR